MELCIPSLLQRRWTGEARILHDSPGLFPALHCARQARHLCERCNGCVMGHAQPCCGMMPRWPKVQRWMICGYSWGLGKCYWWSKPSALNTNQYKSYIESLIQMTITPHHVYSIRVRWKYADVAAFCLHLTTCTQVQRRASRGLLFTTTWTCGWSS